MQGCNVKPPVFDAKNRMANGVVYLSIHFSWRDKSHQAHMLHFRAVLCASSANSPPLCLPSSVSIPYRSVYRSHLYLLAMGFCDCGLIRYSGQYRAVAEFDGEEVLVISSTLGVWETLADLLGCQLATGYSNSAGMDEAAVRRSETTHRHRPAVIHCNTRAYSRNTFDHYRTPP